MTQKRLGIIVLLLAVVFGLGFRALAISLKSSLTHDEGISYLAATGHEGKYKITCLEDDPPVGAWVPASEWKRFIRPDEFLCFQRIGRDLADYDFHPPLYFWLLHIWTTLVGVHLWSGPALNLLLFLLMVGFLYRFAVLALGSSFEASVVVFVFGVSPYALQSSVEARQYDLLALLSFLMAWLTVELIRNNSVFSWKKLIGLLAVTLCGALTHYHFAFVVLGCSVLAVVRLFGRKNQRLVYIHAVLVAGYILFVLVHQEFLSSFRLQRTATEAFAWGVVPSRLMTVASSVSQFVVHKRVGEVALLLVCAMIIVAVVFVVRKKFHSTPTSGIGRPSIATYIPYFLTWNVGIISLLYVLQLSPVHAMGPKYLGVAWPFLAFVPVMALGGVTGRTRHLLLLLFCAWQLAYATTSGFVSVVRGGRGEAPAFILSDAENVVCDTLARGVFPRIFSLVPDSTVVFAAKQPLLLEKQEAWLRELKVGSLYVSSLAYSNSREAQITVLSAIERRYEVVTLSAKMFGYDFYAITGARTGAFPETQETVRPDSTARRDSH